MIDSEENKVIRIVFYELSKTDGIVKNPISGVVGCGGKKGQR